MVRSPLRFFDPLYGRVELDDLEGRLVLSPEFQRLRCIRMCNINSMLVSGASEISRFEHSVGVLRLAQLWGETNGVAGDDRIVLRAAALLHDMQTGPFGHSLQYVVEDNQLGSTFVHDDILHGYQEQFHQRLLATASYQGTVFSTPKILSRLWSRVAEAIKGKGKFGPLISGSLDLDNLDNVVRLAYHVGVATTDDVRQIPDFVKQLSVVMGELSVPPEGVQFIERWQQIRTKLYELLLLDWAEFSAKAMLTLAIERAFDSGLLDQQSWLLTDAGLLSHLEAKGVGELQDIGELVRRLKTGSLYQPIFLATIPETKLYETLGSTAKKRELEKEIAARLRSHGRSPGKVLVHLILDHKKTSRSVRAHVQGAAVPTVIGIDSKQLLIGVFSSVELPPATRELAEMEFTQIIREHTSCTLTPLTDPVMEANSLPQTSSMQLDLGLT